MAEAGFFEKVYAVVKKIPRGKVMSYGQVAALCGNARAARVVGWALRSTTNSTDIPWQRVVNSQGFLTIVNEKVTTETQKNLLEQENVVVEQVDGLYKVDLAKYLAKIS